jgi:hypothetical protein
VAQCVFFLLFFFIRNVPIYGPPVLKYLVTFVSSFLKQEGKQSEILNDYFPEVGLKKVCK